MTHTARFAETRLSNGLRIVCEVMPRVSSTALGFLVATGSRHERADEHGVSHFLEHMCFKGTPTRDWRAINVAFDELGSIYNAFTGKDHTFYYGWVPSDRWRPQLDLLADMLRPALPPHDFETERNVILEEIAMSGDNFDHHVWNFLHETVFHQHPLAHEILGEKETIAALPRDLMVDYHRRRYAPANVTLIVSGAVDPEQIFAAAERSCAAWPGGDGPAIATPPPAPPRGMKKLRLEQFNQQALMLIYPSIPAAHADNENVEAFQSLFGGANSRCYWNVVQKGVCSQAGAAWISYDDCGVMALFADGEPEKCEEMLTALRTQAEEVARHGFSDAEVQRVKNRTRTRLALEAESPRTRLMQLIDDLETYGRPREPEERQAAVEAVTQATIAAHLERYPITGEGLLLSVGPRDWP